MHDHDQDYEVTEPVVAASDEDSDAAQRSHTARFWRSQPSPASSAEADPASAGSADGETGPQGRAFAAGDPDTADEAALGDEAALDDDEAALDDDEAALDDDDVLLGDDDVVVVAEVMDAGPGSPAGDEQRPGSPVVVPAAREASDPDAPDLEAPDPDASDLEAPDPDATDPGAAVGPDNAAEPMIAEPGQTPEPALAQTAVLGDTGDVPAAATDRPDVAGAADPAAVAEPGPDRPEQSFASQEWREIQASFVDDPHAAVQMAAQAADSALTALVTALREQQASLDPSATQDTEQLRAALQEYRRFSQAISEVGRSLPGSSASR